MRWARSSARAAGVTVATALLASAAPAIAEDDQDFAPAPPSIGADVPVTYFAPPPSSVKRELVGPYQELKAGKIDLDKGTLTLPLYEGALKSGETVWYIVTDTDDKGNADALGLNYSSKLTFSEVGRAVRKATLDSKFKLVFEAGKVDFAPKRSATPGDAPNFFPPKQFQPGSVGDREYSPLVKILNAGGHIYNAPMLAFNVSAERLNQFCDGNPDYSIVHDKVVKICPREKTVTVQLTTGFSFAKPVLYLSTDTNNPLTATAEASTLLPAWRTFRVAATTVCSVRSNVFSFSSTDRPARATRSAKVSIAPCRMGSRRSTCSVASPLWRLTTARSGISTPQYGRKRRSRWDIAPASPRSSRSSALSKRAGSSV
jgi:hypothetical protein